MKRLLLASVLVVAALYGSVTAHADPDCTLHNTQLCGDPGKVTYCPDTGGFVTAFSGYCPSLVFGPYAPGGLQSPE